MEVSMRKALAPAVAAALLLFVVMVPALAGAPFVHATGSVGLSGPMQYASFNAFDYGATGDRGTINYTNFELATPGTGVWNISGWQHLIVTLGGTYAHTLTIDRVTPTSPTSMRFRGSGAYDADGTYTWTVKGTVTGSNIDFDITYTGTSAGYVFSAVGTIAPDGSMSGTATDTLLQAPLTWTAPAGSAYEVFSYTAPVTCAVVLGADATFVFTIPTGVPYAGTPVVVKIHDGGSPGTNGDTWAHGVATSPCDGPVGAYPIVRGNLVVH